MVLRGIQIQSIHALMCEWHGRYERVFLRLLLLLFVQIRRCRVTEKTFRFVFFFVFFFLFFRSSFISIFKCNIAGQFVRHFRKWEFWSVKIFDLINLPLPLPYIIQHTHGLEPRPTTICALLLISKYNIYQENDAVSRASGIGHRVSGNVVCGSVWHECVIRYNFMVSK